MMGSGQSNPEQYRFLIVEDELVVANLLKAHLTAGFPSSEIIIASDGIDALEKLRAEVFDLVISDWEMPFMEGDELLLNIRENAKTKDVPVLMVSVRRDSGSVITAMQAGVTDYITKPFERETLFRKTRKLLATRPVHPDETGAKGERTVSPAQEALHAHVKRLAGEGKMPLVPAPQVIVLVDEAVRSLEFDSRDLAAAVDSDPAVAAAFLNAVNAGYYDAIPRCAEVHEAVTAIGPERTRDLVSLLAVRTLFHAGDARLRGVLDSLFLHSAATAAAAASLAIQMRIENVYDFFMMGLLHDIGRLVILRAASEESSACRELDLDALMEVIDALHSKVGGMLLAQWKLPRIYSVIALKHEFSSAREAPEQELQLVYLANEVIKRLGYSVRDPVRKECAEIQADLPGLDEHLIGVLAGEVDRVIRKVKLIL